MTMKARGTAAMSPDVRKKVASKGGKTVSKNRAHMAEIGRKGGLAVSKNRDHMAAIGRKGGSKGSLAAPTPVSEETPQPSEFNRDLIQDDGGNNK